MKKFKTYTNLLLKYNKVHRLSGSKNEQEVEKNIEDSLYPINFIDFENIKKVVDIGTGAGFPGMILAIELPDVHFTLVEPLMKRTAFLHLVKSTYGLQNVDIIRGRIEDAEAFEADLITSRAVAKTGFLIDLSKNFVGENTEFLFYKGENVYDEVNDDMNYEIIKRDKRNYLWIKKGNR
ncbi:MAG TPA: 16S rRNA (guanine(527)-N(7))-methyltransferase RsmG [Campylobacterales bacterium]|nr:16S rRNA (guanine(527)-N(7))-methyltransferase RsmG [Campylobacterales bacterium]HIP58835.1 16S rRNA (guanine(527)-N(7))-methyltransferase RsmG [Campylobacterales bacterium]